MLSCTKPLQDDSDIRCRPLPSKSRRSRCWRTSISRIVRRNRDKTTSLDEKRLADGVSSKERSTDVKAPAEETQCGEDNSNNLELSSRIVDIVSRYELPSKGDIGPETNTRLLAQVNARVLQRQPILMCLPAFPFKSPNTSSKVLGNSPDKAEEVALAHLEGLCAAISHLYEPGARLMIVSDGLVYNGM